MNINQYSSVLRQKINHLKAVLYKNKVLFVFLHLEQDILNISLDNKRGIRTW